MLEPWPAASVCVEGAAAAAATLAARRLSFFRTRCAWRTARREANNAGASSGSPSAAAPGVPAGVLGSRRGTAAAGRTKMAVTADATACTVLRGAPAWHAARTAAAKSAGPSTTMISTMSRTKGASLLQLSLEPGLAGLLFCTGTRSGSHSRTTTATTATTTKDDELTRSTRMVHTTTDN